MITSPILHSDLLLITSVIEINVQSRLRCEVLIQCSGNILANFIIPLIKESVFSIAAEVQGVQLKSLVGVACDSTHVINTENDLIFSKLIKWFH